MGKKGGVGRREAKRKEGKRTENGEPVLEAGEGRGSGRSAAGQEREGPRGEGSRGGEPSQSERLVSLEEMRTAKYCFALQPEYKRVAKYLSDLERLLLDRKCEEARPLIDSVGKMFGSRDKTVRKVLLWIKAEAGRGHSQMAYEITSELLEGAFRFSPYGMHCWSEYRQRFEREFPEVVCYNAPMEIALTRYASLVVEFYDQRKRKQDAVYKILMERSRDSDAELTFISHEGGAAGEMRITWAGVAVPTTHFFDHKAFRIQLPRKGECQVDLLGEAGPLYRFKYDTKPAKHGVVWEYQPQKSVKGKS
ncbi:MAG: hypothetical protein ACREDR_06185 [Blastocatellia bacterium]